MAYATKENIKSMFRDFADNLDAAVSDDELDLFIENTTEVIDAKLSILYALPIIEIDSPKSFKILKQIQMYKVADIVDGILNNYSEADKKPEWGKKGHMILKSLVPDLDKNGRQPKPLMILTDATYLKTETQANRISAKATTGTVIKKNQDNW